MPGHNQFFFRILAVGLMGLGAFYWVIGAPADLVNPVKIITGPLNSAKNIFKAGVLAEENLLLRMENAKLEAQLVQLTEDKPLHSGWLEYRPAEVYSTYPFNNQKVLEINLGANDGVKLDMPVAASPGILLGRISAVYPRHSLVKTIFDQEFKMPVKIGKSTDALFEGGNNPRVTLINKNQNLKSGDAIYSAGSQFPYGLKAGNVAEIQEEQGEFFRAAEVQPDFGLNEINKVYIITNFLEQ